jgi:hypothetical protein
MSQKRGLLGQILLERELVAESDLEQALARQVLQGGRLGSNLVERGSLSIEALANALSYQLGVAAADLQRATIDESALATLPAAICDKYKILPLRLHERTLHLAMQDPQRRDLVDHLSAALRVHIQPYVVPQLRLLYALERFHRIPRPKRYLREPAANVQQGKQDERRAYLAATVDAQPTNQTDRAGVTSSAHVIAPPPSAETPPHPGVDPLSTGAATSEFQLVFLDDVERPSPRDDKAASQELEIDVAVEAHDAVTSQGTVVSAREVIEQLDRSTDRESVATALVRPLSADTTLSLLLLPRGPLAVTVAASGGALPIEQVRALVVPLDAPSLLRRAIEQERAVAGAVPDDPLLPMMATYLRAPCAQSAVTVPICVDQRIAHILCVQYAGALESTRIDELSDVATAAAKAYGRLIELARP